MDFLKSELKIEFSSLAIIGYIYSFILAFFFLNYYRNKKFCSCKVFWINVVHTSLVFFMPILAYMTLTTEDSLFFVKDSKKCYKMIKYINIANHALNKFIYPLMIVYIRSGFFSFKDKFSHLSFSDVCYELYAYVFIIIVLIIYFPFKDELLSIYHDDGILFFLNYLNILDLIYTYFDIGFSCGSMLRYFYAVFTRREEYQEFLLGKLSIYEEDIKKDFRRRFTRFYTLAKLYSKDIHKYRLYEVNQFISNVDVQIYYDKDHYKQPFEKVDNIKKFDLERVLAKSYGLSKGLFRRIRRIETLKELQINRIKKKHKKRCCGCIYICCISGFFKRVKCLIFAAACLAILVCEGFYFAKNNDQFLEIFNQTSNIQLEENSFISFNQNNTNNSKNSTDTNVGIQLSSLLLIYPLYIIVIFATCGIYIIPIFYSMIRRTFITGDFIYEKSCADTLEMIISVRKLSTKIFSALYLSSLFYITFVLNEPFNSKEENYEFLQFYKVPHSPFILAARYVFIIAIMIFSRLVESINFKCCVFNLCDECYFEPRPCEPCVRSCIEPKRQKYIQAGRKIADRILNRSDNNPIKNANEEEFLADSSQN